MSQDGRQGDALAQPGLARRLGTTDAVVIGLGSMIGAGVFTNWAGSSGFYIADNTFIGRNDPNHLIGWAGDFWARFDGVDGQTFPPKMYSYVAVKLYGPGHVVAHNYIAHFHDGINIAFAGRLHRLDLKAHSGGKSVLVYGAAGAAALLVLAAMPSAAASQPPRSPSSFSSCHSLTNSSLRNPAAAISACSSACVRFHSVMSWKAPCTRMIAPVASRSARPIVRTHTGRPREVSICSSRSKGVPCSTHEAKAARMLSRNCGA